MKPVTHTPAPWVYRRPPYELMRGQLRSFEVNAKSNGIYKPCIADVRSMGVDGRDNSEANARLIAAAPDLLAALESVMRLHGDYISEHSAIVKLVRAAIAKAVA